MIKTDELDECLIRYKQIQRDRTTHSIPDTLLAVIPATDLSEQISAQHPKPQGQAT